MRFLTEIFTQTLATPGEFAVVRPFTLALTQDDIAAIRAAVSKDLRDIRIPVKITVPARYIIDFASIPRMLRGVLNVNGRSRRPAGIHDWLYGSQELPREICDQIFKQALIAEGMKPWQAQVYYLGVRSGGWVPWGKRLKRGGGLMHDDFLH